MSDQPLENSMSIEIPMKLADLAQQERFKMGLRLLQETVTDIEEVLEPDWDDDDYQQAQAKLRAYFRGIRSTLNAVTEEDD